VGGGLVWCIARVFGNGALGPVIVSVLLIGVILAIFARRIQHGSPVTATGTSR
jgi:hypothetical protein